MNVVHAGLDIVRDELRNIISANNSNEATTPSIDKAKGLLELVEDIFAASDSAISILNDLLDYEHMDAGVCGTLRLFICTIIHLLQVHSNLI